MSSGGIKAVIFCGTEVEVIKNKKGMFAKTLLRVIDDGQLYSKK